jgi:hydroxymethylpyrimidine/phosphomethylpyrimidine kinase
VTTIALTIAGSDSGGGAGIQADLKTFSALGVYGASVLTAVTAQNTRGVQGVHDIPSEMIRLQLRSVLSDLKVGASKIGMLSREETILAVVDGLRDVAHIPVVLDPVMVATSGDMLLQPAAVAALKERLMPLAAVIVPNLHEASRLTGEPVAATEPDMLRQGRMLFDSGARAVLMKGGHGIGPECVDLLVTADSVERLAAPRIPTRSVHGTGCTLSAAIAANLALGETLPEACRRAKDYVTSAIAAAGRLAVGGGQGPAHHLHAWW